jgi:predicted glycogen debranching enzyme
MTIDFGRDICNELVSAEKREWLVTNGIGGFAMGTISDILSRRYHGLLIAALNPPLGRTLLVTKLDASAGYGGKQYNLFANRWSPEDVEPDGYKHIERFRLDGSTPVWTYTFADAVLEKRIWMQPGANTTYVHYNFLRGSGPLALVLDAYVNYRDYHSHTAVDGLDFSVTAVEHGICATASPNAPASATPVYILASAGSVQLRQMWHADFFAAIEHYRGTGDYDANLLASTFSVMLEPGSALTLVATTDASADLDGDTAYAVRQSLDEVLLNMGSNSAESDPAIEQLILAADQFIVTRDTPYGAGHSIIAGFPWFSDWGRDTMIALPGLTLHTGRARLARSILQTFSHFVDQGMLPNRFPDAGEAPEYNTIDATLWYFEAIRAYHAHTGDDSLIKELFIVLDDIIDWHTKGTRYNIKADSADGLVYGGNQGVQLTWMDAKVDLWVVTPRIGKPVEISALWYNALRCMIDFAAIVGLDDAKYEKLADLVQTHFQKFWNAEKGYCFDVIEGPDGNDDALRPNQLFAVSLPYSPLTPAQQKAVVAACTRELLTPHGLRSLSPKHSDYQGVYGGDRVTRDAAYHQGTTWGWLIGPYVAAHLRVYHDKTLARSFLEPLLRHLNDHCVGSLSEVFDGDAPYTPRGCNAQAWTVAEVLRCWALTAET